MPHLGPSAPHAPISLEAQQDLLRRNRGRSRSPEPVKPRYGGDSLQVTSARSFVGTGHKVTTVVSAPGAPLSPRSAEPPPLPEALETEQIPCTRITPLNSHTGGAIEALALAGDGRTAYTVDMAGRVCATRLASGDAKSTFGEEGHVEHGGWGRALLLWEPSGKDDEAATLFVAGSVDNAGEQPQVRVESV